MIYDINNLTRDFNAEELDAARELCQNGKVKIQKVRSRYDEMFQEPIYEVSATVATKKDKFVTVNFKLSYGSINSSYCDCDRRASFGRVYYYMNNCEHVAAALIEAIHYFEEHPEKILMNRSVMSIINYYQNGSVAKSMAKKQEKMELVPNLESDESGMFYLGFKIGNSKKYVVKDLYLLDEAFEQKEVLIYGKNFEVLHHMEAFTEESQKMITFIRTKIAENRIFLKELESFNRMPNRRFIRLTPRAMDDFFEIMGETSLAWHDKSAETKSLAQKEIRFVKGNPAVEVKVEKFSPAELFAKETSKRSRKFSGISVRTNVDAVVNGSKHLYVLIENTLYQSEQSFQTVMEPFLKSMLDNENYIYVDAAKSGSFYQQVIGRIKPFVVLDEYDPEELHEILPPEPEFSFYLDYDNRNIVCDAQVMYGEKKYLLAENEELREDIANLAKEYEVRAELAEIMPYYDPDLKLYHCGGDDDLMFDVLEYGMNRLVNSGMVYISEKLKQLRIKPNPKVTVGVAINNNLLDMTIASEDVDFKELKDVLSSYKQKKRFHRLKDGNYLKLEESSLETLVEMVEAMHLSIKDFTKGKMRIPAYRALYLDKMLEDGEDINYTRDKKVKAMLRDFKSVKDSDYEVPESLVNILRKYQKEGYRWLRTLESYHMGGILADDMGLGKTIQVLAVLLAAKEEGNQGSSLIVCPASLVYNWENEVKHFAPQLSVKVLAGSLAERERILMDLKDTDIVVTSYDLLKRDIAWYENINFLYQIIDEAQYIKNPSTQASKAVKLIQANTKFALTGTPIENRLSELWSIFDYLMPGFLYKYEQFKKEMETPITKIKDEKVAARLRKMVSPFILRRIKRDVLKDLPDKLEQVTYAKMEEEQSAIYKAYIAKIKQQLDKKTAEEFQSEKLQILAELTRLRQICCEPSLVYTDYRKESGKLSTCMELLENAVDGGHKVLLFSQFTSMLSIIENRLIKEGISYYKITGQTKKEERIRLVNQFNEDDTTVFLISLKAGGTGLNLTGADIVIHYDPWWNVAAQNQATDRAHRIGQKNVVTVFQLIAQGTIEEKIITMQEEKKHLADQIITEDTNQLQSMTKEDFVELLQG